ncbi:MAG: sensor histidine kinase [Anaerolineales bacterium]|jgi:signal transduction histidine kinase
MIDFIRNLFTVNHELIYFIYGLMFFVLGLAIALQSRHSSRLDLARSLNWLAAFGFLHGFHEWGDLFIPLQSAYLAPGIILYLRYFDLLLLAVSFACLYGFGLALLEPLEHCSWLHVVFAALLVAWLGLILFPFRIWFVDFNVWNNAADALTRYFIGLPSGLLAAYALREHTLKRIAPYDVPRIVRALQLSGIAMAVYALAAGLIPPAVSFFPGNLLNTDTFTQYLLIPPQLFRALIGLAMAMTTIRSLEIFDVETSRRIEAMEQDRMLAEERERIARELHDGTIQKVYTAGLLVRSAEKLASAESPLAGRLATAVGVLDDAISDLRQNLNQLHAPAKSPEPLKLTIQKMATDPRFSALVNVELDLDLPDSYYLSPERTVHVLAIIQEALSNIIRHARARHVTVTADCREDHLRVIIKDDGVGLPVQLNEGHGLRNMRDRASLLRGQVAIEKFEKGTRVTLDIPLEGSR